MKLLIIVACLGLVSCTPLEREITEEAVEVFIEYEKHNALDEPDVTGGLTKHDDTQPASAYKGRKEPNSLDRHDTRGHIAYGNQRQYPPRGQRNVNRQDKGM